MSEAEKVSVEVAKVMASKSLAQNMLHDLKSLRSLWNYAFLSLYVWVVSYLVLYHAETCGNSVVYTTGGIVASVFTNYCFFSHADKKLNVTPVVTPDQPQPGLQDAGEGDGNG